MANFEAFYCNFSSSIKLLFLKSGVLDLFILPGAKVFHARAIYVVCIDCQKPIVALDEGQFLSLCVYYIVGTKEGNIYF